MSIELGGTDQDVKEYFFSLRPSELTLLLMDYGMLYGEAAERYASDTMHKWKSGHTQMSGTVAERLFRLLPPRMPLDIKYKLTENLWHHYGPRSRRAMRIGLDANLEQVLTLVRSYIDEVVTHYRIPAELERRFHWLSAGDVGVKQDLLNHLRAMERTLVVDAARLQLPVLIQHLQSTSGKHTSRLAQVLVVGKHELEIIVDPGATGVRIEEPSERTRTAGTSSGGFENWITVFVIAAIIFVALWLNS